MNEKPESCFNCHRSETEIPVIAWRYQGQALWVCSECMPNLIHKWPQVVAKRRAAAEGSQNDTV
jgi:hypothetical protein